jgi:spore germination cell wall hydrolase CwlJ-like protein
MVSRAVIRLRLAGRGRSIVAATTLISLLGAASALIDQLLIANGSASSADAHVVVIYRNPSAAAADSTALSPQADHLFAKPGKRNRADYDDIAARAETAGAASDKPQFVAASLTPLDMSMAPRAVAPIALPPQDVNRSRKADLLLTQPQLSVARIVAPMMERPQDATDTSAALFFITPPQVGPAESSASAAPAPADTGAIGDGGPTIVAAANATSPHAAPTPQTTWSDLIKLASVGAGDGEKTGTNIFGGLTEKEFRAREFRCMATAIYFEARDESIKGQIAVGQVIMTRVRSSYYPNTICGVVYQGQWNKNACQFSFACDGLPDVPREHKEWETALNVAKDVISGKVYLEEVGDATHYHATYVSPSWTKLVKRVAKVGGHIFYKAPFAQPLVASADFNKL